MSEVNQFKIGDEFYLNGEPFQIRSGAFHYFRVFEEEWEHTLKNMRALGLNTVETYVPWNMIEPLEEEFQQEHVHLLQRFIEKVQEEGFYLLLRPSPYICSEWEFGGLPAWLLNYPQMRLRTNDELFLEKIDRYYRYFLPQVCPYQFDQGGPILMMQVENEYGSYAHDKDYLRAIAKMMRKYGVTVPLFTSDGTWTAALESGSLIEEDILVTGNFGSRVDENLGVLSDYFKKHKKEWPLMSMEFWDGWFNRWGEDIVRRDPDELAEEVEKMAKRGSFNLYMFHGGTNFSWMNGCSARKNKDLAQITSYDYGALLNEEGNPSPQFFTVQKALKRAKPTIKQSEPFYKKISAYPSLDCESQLALFDVLDTISEAIKSDYPLSFEELDNPYGYVIYRTQMKNYSGRDKIRLIETSDRAYVYANQKLQAIQFQESMGDEVYIDEKDNFTLDVLVENMGRVNYGFKLQGPSQRKGIRGGIMHDMHFHRSYLQYPLSFDKAMINKLPFVEGRLAHSRPSFSRFILNLDSDEITSTFIDCQNLGKGVVFVNGFNLGRYWSIGPVYHLYLPGSLLKEGRNEIVVFETEKEAPKNLSFSNQQIKD